MYSMSVAQVALKSLSGGPCSLRSRSSIWMSSSR